MDEHGEFPETFSSTSRRIVSQQYFRNGEQSFWDVVARVVNAITAHGEKFGYFTVPHDADRFAERLARGLLEQRFSFNSPVWYNLGVNDEPQCSACFIQPVEDNMGSIMQLATNEAMLFKHGSGTGTNLSSLRSSRETLSKSDGFASGPVSFMRMYDAVAGAIKSGGRTRRAAKMQLLDVDHPDIMEFIEAKAYEGTKAKTLIASGMAPADAYASVSLQNMNTSVRVTDNFMDNPDGLTYMKSKTGPTLGLETNAAILDAMALAAWECGDPGVQFTDAIERDNMVPEFPINASNPCSEFVFMDNSACNLASLNLLKYEDLKYADFSLDIRTLVYAMDIIVGLSSYPTGAIGRNSHEYRPIGLGFSNLGALLMRRGLLYDSKEARAIASEYAKDIMCEACRASGELARIFGAYPGYGEAQAKLLRAKCGGDLPESVRANGVRNAQLTLVAPTGTISFMMGCESTGIEPVFAETFIKTLAGGERITMYAGCVEVYNKRLLSGTDYGSIPDTAIGSNPVSPMGHLLMMAAVQPYLSGAISKTVNLPADASVADIKQVYQSAWSLGLKCVAVFRDGCKGWQPMEAKPQHIDTNAGDSIQLRDDLPLGGLVPFDSEKAFYVDKSVPLSRNAQILKVSMTGNTISAVAGEDMELGTLVGQRDDGRFYATPKAVDELLKLNSMPGSLVTVDDIRSYNPVATDTRRRMPDTRASVTHKFQLGGVEGYIHIGEYPDGTPGELFVHVNKEGSTVGGLMDAWAICFSMALQYGVPLRKLVDKFRGAKFDPAGFTPNADVPSATSLVDYVVRWMEIRYLFPGELAKAETLGSNNQTPSSPGNFNVAYVNRGPMRTSFYSGDTCPECGHLMVQTGTCKSCPECGHGGGCG